MSGGEHAPNHLTEKGKEEVLRTAQELKGEHINFIFASPLIRTRETAGIMAAELAGSGNRKPSYDERLSEIYIGEFDGKPVKRISRIFFVAERKVYKMSGGGGKPLLMSNDASWKRFTILTKDTRGKIFLSLHTRFRCGWRWLELRGRDQKGAIRLWGESKKDEAVETGSLRKLILFPYRIIATLKLIFIVRI